MMRWARRLWPLLFVWALLGASECSESSINKDINDIFGINTDSPAQVGLAIFAGQTFGSDEEQQAAQMGSTLKDFRRADHEQKGDRYAGSGAFGRAADEYRTALQWTGSGPQQDRKRAALEMRLANALFNGDEQSKTPAADDLEAARHYTTAGDLTLRDQSLSTREEDAAKAYESAALMYNKGGDYTASCRSLRTAIRHGYPDDQLLRQSLKDHGHPCT